MELFENQRGKIVLKVGKPADVKKFEQKFQQIYNADYLKSAVKDFWPYIETSDIYQGKKYSYYTKPECAHFLALLHSDPNNLKTLFAKLPQYVSISISAALRFGYAGQTMLNAMNASQAFAEKEYYWYFRPEKAKYMELIGIAVAKSHQGRYKDEPYLYVPDFLRPVYAKALLSDMTEDDIFLDSFGDNVLRYTAEKEFITSFPVITGMYRQGLIKTSNSGYKMTAASAAKVMANLSTKEVLRSTKDCKCSTGQYFLPCLVKGLDDDKTKHAEDYVKMAYQLLRDNYSGLLLPALLPHIKGFRTNYMFGRTYWGRVLEECFSIHPDKWLLLDNLQEYLYHCPSGEFCGCGVTNFDRMELVNSFTDEIVYLDDQFWDIDLEAMKATAVAMYGLGMVDLAVAVDKDDRPLSSPCERIVGIKLTDLGKYVLGLAKTYTAETAVSKEWFRLDKEHLIVSSTAEDNPYEGLLAEIATPIGGGRYLIDSSSFLKKCNNPGDVQDKIGFFRDYICSEPPQIWKSFFESLKNHCSPFAADKEPFVLLQVGENNTELMKLLTADAQLRKLVMLVEGRRILVKSKNLQAFDSLLKSKGYLL